MKVLVTGSSGHLGEALMRILPDAGHEAIGLDVKPGPFTQGVASITEPGAVAEAMEGCEAVLHTATLHKPHVATHTKADFVSVNVTGTLNLLEAAARQGIAKFVFTSTTSAFGDALRPLPGAPAAWIDETVVGAPKNIYGATKTAAEDICALFARNHGMTVTVLRTSRFFPEQDDDRSARNAWDDQNLKAIEFLYRRVDIQDAAEAHITALRRVPEPAFSKYIVSAPSPFRQEDRQALTTDAARVISGYYPQVEETFQRIGYRLPNAIGRVYDSRLAVQKLGWRPRFNFARVLSQLAAGQQIGSDLTRLVGVKGYHDQVFEDGPFPVEP